MYETDVNGLIYIKLIITSKVKIRRSRFIVCVNPALFINLEPYKICQL